MDNLNGKKIAFYTLFFGNDANWANLIPHVPSEHHDCYYFTNNQQTYNKVTWSKWSYIFMDHIPIHNDDVKDAMSTKEMKACPHRFPILDQYDYTVYFDSKNFLDADKIIKLIEDLDHSNSHMILPEHSCHFHNVWDEYNLCLKYPKYASQQTQYKAYLDKYLQLGFTEHINTHYTTHLIIRKKSDTTREINETWFRHIQECGIECQISFSIVQQLYQDTIQPIEYLSCYSYM